MSDRSTFANVLMHVFLSVAVSGCAAKSLISEKNAGNSRIEISYVLGHVQYRYVAVGGPDAAEVSSSRNDKTLEKKKIPLSRYRDFAARLEQAIRSTPEAVAPESGESCRTPYRIRIFIEDREYTTSGCRSADPQGQIGQLLNEGEFLFYAAEPRSGGPGTDVPEERE